MDERARKFMTIHKDVHSRDDRERLYVSKNDGGRGLANIEDFAVLSIPGLENYIKKRTNYSSQQYH